MCVCMYMYISVCVCIYYCFCTLSKPFHLVQQASPALATPSFNQISTSPSPPPSHLNHTYICPKPHPIQVSSTPGLTHTLTTPTFCVDSFCSLVSCMKSWRTGCTIRGRYTLISSPMAVNTFSIRRMIVF